MAVKAVNDSAGPNGLILTLLVFGAFPRMTEFNPPTPSIATRAMVIKKAMNEITKIRAEHQVTDALQQRNGPSTTNIHDLPLRSPVLVWREGNIGQAGHWEGPFALLRIEGETCKVQLLNGPTDFCSTVIKPYQEPSIDTETDPATEPHDENTVTDEETRQEKPQEPLQERPQRVHQLPARFQQNVADISVYLTDDVTPFTESQRKEINGLLERGVFMVVNKADIPQGI